MTKAPAAVLVAHRDRSTCDAVRTALEQAGFETLVWEAKGPLHERIGRKAVQLAVLDSRVAFADAEKILDALREHAIPVVCLARGADAAEPADVLERGCDDVLREPFSARELVARVKAVLRGYERSRTPSEVATLGPITVDRGSRVARVRGKSLDLTRSELELLACLVTSPGRVFRREELLPLILAPGKQTTPRLIDTHLVSLRRKLGAAGSWIETIRGYGYRARADRGS